VSGDSAALAERRRLELSRVSSGGAGLTVERVGAVIGDKRASVRKAAGQPVDLLRFAAFRCSFSDTGLTATYRDASTRTLRWADIARVSVRQLPGDPPWDSAIVVDLVSTQEPSPLRLLTGTFIAFQTLPGGASTSPIENVRRLCQQVRRLCPGAVFDEPTARFCDASGPCPRVLGMRQFSEYDARFG
jgi:hypothetical protein